ncbi:hypothetical protein HZY91_01750 [Facklamia sp. DSM 111018]|uniref:Iron-sulfur cluster biosynthesis protein n=1 Tax=Facklamia lactis TaxID=2749967 RepID=A0ABS0LNC8_9LACT|nr:hypothetical protein [Facklamia lactis]MBG9979707.1 hypothetical protein [Facklamia lactis]MBG9985613.1 hypothetical protein [Facklamia lactis]
MKLAVDQAAANWFKEEVGLRKGAGIRFKTKIYSSSPLNKGFGLAIEPSEPSDQPIAEYTADNGIYFFIEENDLWFFDGHDLEVTLDEQGQEPYYHYLKDGVAIN